MIRRRDRRPLLAVVLVIALGGVPGLGLATRALQLGEIFSPASGHAQVIAQGVSTLPGETAWRVVFHSIDPGGATELAAGGPGFILADTGGVLVDDGGRSALLAPAEASFRAGQSSRLIPIGERPAGLFAIDLVPADAVDDAGDGIPVFASAPFETPDGARDIDLVRDLLEPDESTTVIGNEAPVLVLVTLGALRAEATDGSTASLRVGEAAIFSGDIVLSGEGQAPSTFVAAVIGREAPVAVAAGTPGATPAVPSIGSVQITVYACPPAVEPGDASPGSCLRDPEAVALELAAIDGEALRDVGPSTEMRGLPTWTGLPGGDYVLQATGFTGGFARFFVPGLEGSDGRGDEGYAAGDGDGYVIPIGGDAADYALEVYVFAAADDATPAPAAPTAGSTEVPSVIQIETPAPGAEPTATATPRATSTPRPAPIATATPSPTESPIISSTAVARPQQGSVDVQIFGCLDSIETFDPANCAQAVDSFDVQLISEDGDVISLDDATIESDGSITWENLPLGSYLFQQPLLLPGAATYYVPALPLADGGNGYVVTIAADEPVASVAIFNLPPSVVPTPPIAPAPTAVPPVESDVADPPVVEDPPPVDSAIDSDADRLPDADEVALGTDPNNPDTDGDGFFDGDEVNLGTDPLDPTSFPSG